MAAFGKRGLDARGTESATISLAPAKKTKGFCSSGKALEQNYKWVRSVTNADALAKCVFCKITFPIKGAEEKALKRHQMSERHQQSLQLQEQNSFIPECAQTHSPSRQSFKVTAAEVTSVYHGMKHNHSRMSLDCDSRLAQVMSSDLAIATKVRCGAKADNIMMNVLAPYSEELFLQDLGSSYFSISSDASNKGNKKMFPLVLQYFHRSDGIQQKLLDIYEDHNESAESVVTKIKDILLQKGLQLQQVSSYSADNASFTYWKHHSISKHLQTEMPHIIPVNNLCHVLHNCGKDANKTLAKYDVEMLVLKLHSEFSSSNEDVAHLKDVLAFLDQDWKEILHNVFTRWLTLLPTVSRLVECWPAIKSYFISQGPEECHPLIWKFVEDEEDGFSEHNISEAECYIHLHYILPIFHESLMKLESSTITAPELYAVMQGVRGELQNRLDDQYFGAKVASALRLLPQHVGQQVSQDFTAFYSRAISYLQSWFDFNSSPLKSMQVFSLQETVTWDKLCTATEALNLKDVDMDALYSDYLALRTALPILLNMTEASVADRWVNFFSNAEDCSTLYRVVQFVLSIPATNSYVEQVFSLMATSWTNQRDEMVLPLIKAELQVKLNFNLSCEQFHAFVKDNQKFLEVAKSSDKYPFKHKYV
ncbi:phosphatidylinositol-glycan biosynthesis class X protein isoform X1 [Protopterus annectens]|uniref:phosphatidylinositol-glycan biosynthesis class X protein isoform X1 n=1 Tax=Protopterus annectens TaxID=7888 RepID=UPI001CFC399A|nr:phosphatidylinositol-glycan biosynthesis class X protein isoform X1 [Protopterus annectens]XP_043926247.1 phosphatidylinositol-glycan biosynthesis class X protein isoform X1 [Protopterus annectens]